MDDDKNTPKRGFGARGFELVATPRGFPDREGMNLGDDRGFGRSNDGFCTLLHPSDEDDPRAEHRAFGDRLGL
jgi:hypothetical protein